MKIKSIVFNWSPGAVAPTRTVGVEGVTEIKGFSPRVDGDRWNYVVKYEDGSAERIFNPNLISYFAKED